MREREATRGDEHVRSSWTWSVGARLTGRWGTGVAITREDGPHVPRPPRLAAPCHVAAVCVWERRARHDALVRMRAMVSEVSR